MRNKKKKSLPLPHDLIVEILSRLPVKSLVRFRCVSKSWLSLSSDPQFAKSHFELAAAPSHRLLYISASDYQVRSIDLETSLHDDSAAVNLLLPLPNSPDSLRNFRILGSCRGFILLANYSNLIIWNPLTGVHKRLPYSPIASKFDKTFEFTLMYGLGYDASTDDYLIVTASFDDREADWITRLELFSVRSNSWKEIEGSQFPYTNDMVQSGLLFNGAIHWLAFRHDESVRVIVAFDLIQKNLTEVSLPDCDLEDFLGDLWIVGGCLGLFYWRWGENKTEMWVMKEYKVRSSWTKYDLPWSYIAPMYTAKSGELVAYAHRGRLMKFNDAGQLLEQCTYCDDRRGCILAMYRESLLSLPTDCGEAREDEQQ